MRKNGFGQLLAAKGMTQKAMAVRLGVSGASVNRWVKGKGLPEPELLVQICREFTVSADWLLGLPASSGADAARLETAKLARRLEEIEQAARALIAVILGPAPEVGTTRVAQAEAKTFAQVAAEYDTERKRDAG